MSLKMSKQARIELLSVWKILRGYEILLKHRASVTFSFEAFPDFPREFRGRSAGAFFDMSGETRTPGNKHKN